ncbi:MAG: outer membrane protein assembly factor BamA [Kiritimatiellia bacterium]
MMRKLVLTVVAMTALAGFTVAREFSAPVVAEVRFDSVRPMDPGFLRAHAAVKAGAPYDRTAVGQDVSTLLKTGRFSDVAALVEEMPGGIRLIYRVVPMPKMGAPVILAGAKAIRLSRLLGEIDLQPGDWVDESALGRKAKKVEDLYRREGYADVAVRSTLTMTDTNAGLCAVAFSVEEGDLSRLRSVVFSGNKAIPGYTMRSLLNLPQAWNPWFWFRRPNYDAEDMKFRLEDLRNRYRDIGYLDVKLGQPVITPAAPGRLRMALNVEEGVRYKTGRIEIRGVKLFPLKALSDLVTVKTGDTAAMAAIRAAAKAIRDYYGARGYIQTLVEPLLTPAGPGVTDVAFVVREGRLTMVGDVIIRGNEVTREKVIRRELKVYPGEVFNEVKVEQAERVLMNLNYFESVQGYPVRTLTPGTNDLVLDVIEKPTGLFTVGAGFSSIDSLMGYVEVSQGNFDLLGYPHFMGGGQRLKLGLRGGSESQEYNLSLTEPWFLDRPLSLSGEGYLMSRSYSDYDIDRAGGSTALGFPIPLGARMELRYRLERVRISDVEDDELYTDVDGSEFYYTEEEEHVDSSFGTTVYKDRRDSLFVPTRGYRVSAGGVLTGGPFGFDTDMYTLSLKGERHLPLWWRHVLSLRGSAEFSDAYGSMDEVPLSERYFLGGPRTVRGFKYRDVGPKATRAIVNPDGTVYTEYRPRGGQTLLLAGAEYGIPMGIPHIRLAGFFDIGSLAVDPYDFSCEELAWGSGIGIRLDIPGFPIRLDYTLASDVMTDRSRDETETERWSFFIGYGF